MSDRDWGHAERQYRHRPMRCSLVASMVEVGWMGLRWMRDRSRISLKGPLLEQMTKRASGCGPRHRILLDRQG